MEVCVLAVIDREDSYGYQIMKDLCLCGNVRIDLVPYFAPFGGRGLSDDLFHCTQWTSSQILSHNGTGKERLYDFGMNGRNWSESMPLFKRPYTEVKI